MLYQNMAATIFLFDKCKMKENHSSKFKTTLTLIERNVNKNIKAVLNTLSCTEHPMEFAKTKGNPVQLRTNYNLLLFGCQGLF